MGLQALIGFSEGVCETAENLYGFEQPVVDCFGLVSLECWLIVCLGIGVVGLYRSLFILE